MITKNNFTRLFIYILPGLTGSFISIFTAAIFINYLTSEKYANFLLQHLIITFGTSVLSLYIGRTTIINITNLNTVKKRKIIFSSLVLMSIASLVLSLITYTILILFIKKINLFDVTTSVFLGLVFSSFYLNIEDMAKGLSLNKSSSISNFFFMNGSVSIPAFLLIIFNNEILKSNLFNLSIFIKIVTTSVLLLIILKTQKIKITKIKISHFYKFKMQNFFLCCYGILGQIYFSLDKYIIKATFNSFQLVAYSLSQQIASKIGIISYACSNLMFGKILRNPSEKKNILSANIYFCFYLCSLSCLIILPFFNDILSIILKNKFNKLIAETLKFFILVNIISALKDCFDTFLQTILKFKKDLKYNLIILPFFILGILICLYFKNLSLFILAIFIKEILLVVLKIQISKKYLVNYSLLTIQVAILSIIVILDIFFKSKELYIVFNIIFLIIAYINFNGKLIKKYFF
jgi:O-antigen/teichoic acid export membrane protein